jgi:hypothetical protein
MNNLMRGLHLLCLFFFLIVSCANIKNDPLNTSQKLKNIEFTEIRKLNAVLNMPQVSIINTTKEIKEFYKKINNQKYSKSAPIPVIEEDKESFLILKPQLKKIKYGDIEVQKVESDGSTLFVSYKEVGNQEYNENKQSNPILIIKILNKPKKIKLIQTP